MAAIPFKKRKIFIVPSFEICSSISYYKGLLSNFFIKNRFYLVNCADEADVIIIITCAFDKTREKKAVELIKFYNKKGVSWKKIIVFGCLVKINSMVVKKIKNITLIGPTEIHLFNKLFSPLIPIERMKSSNLISWQSDCFCIMISVGCINNCAYCVIKKAKGPVVSEPIKKILEDFKIGLSLGFKKFELRSDNSGCYGFDIGTDFADLLNKINKIEGDYKIEICSFEPHWVEKLFLKIDKSIFKKISRVGIDIQSVNQRIINLMNRAYSIEKIQKILKTIKKISPNTKIRTDILFCYPTETRKEFLNNFNHPILRYYDEIIPHIFSERQGTPASTLKGRINLREKKRRIKILEKMALENKKIILWDDYRKNYSLK